MRAVPEPGLQARAITKIGMKMMVSDEHALGQMGYVTDEDLADVTQISYLDNAQQERFFLQTSGSNRLALSSFELIRDAIADGLGWGYVPEPLLASGGDENLALLAHGLNTRWYPYLVYSRQPLANHNDSLLSWLNQLVYTEMRRDGLA